MKRLFCLLALLLSAIPAAAQQGSLIVKGGDVKVVKVDQVTIVEVDRTVVTSFPFTITAPPGGATYSWDVPDGVKFTKKAEVLTVASAPKGDLVVSVDVLTVDFDAKQFNTKPYAITLSVGLPGPAPIPPAPLPDVVIPIPPTPSPAPIPAKGFYVLVVCEFTNGAPKLTPAQTNELWGAEMADYVKAKNVQMRKFDKEIDPKNLPDVWKNAFALPRDSVPWIYVSNGDTGMGFTGPLPDNGKILPLIRKYEPK